MAVKIKFDTCHNPILPTFVLAKRNGEKLGVLPPHSVKYSDKMNSYNEISFRVYRKLVNKTLWDNIKDFALLWVSEWDLWFEIKVDLEEGNATSKFISAKSLGEAELSQINVYDVSANTEKDIEKEGYIPTLIYNSVDTEHSLLHKILSFAPHYKIKTVDSSIQNLKRTFDFDGVNIHDALQKVANEINCLIDFSICSGENGKPERVISVYDLESYCFDCGHRGEFLQQCENCGSANIKRGLGEDSKIIVSTSNLTDNIKYTTDVNSVKNCFKLEAADDTMTEAIEKCNPNGSKYIWFISDETRADMPSELADKITAYDSEYDYYNKTHSVKADTSKLTAYNTLVNKYLAYAELEEISETITGFPALVNSHLSSVDFKGLLQKSLMPTIATSAEIEAEYLNHNLTTVAVDSLSNFSKASANSAVLSVAKTLVNNKCSVTINSGEYNKTNYQWTGSLMIEYQGEKAFTNDIVVAFAEGVHKLIVLQEVEKEILSTSAEIVDAVKVFRMADDLFIDRLTKYSLSALETVKDCCNGALNVLIENGAGNADVWAETPDNLYTDLYTPFNNKLALINAEIALRESEIKTIEAIENELETFRLSIQNTLNFENYLGSELWETFLAYRREDIYKNANYSSDGLTGAEIIDRARLFVETAKKDIYKSATLQHSITATLKNLLVMPEFDGLTDYFAVGNWIHILCNDGVYHLRLLQYDIDFDNLSNLNVSFSDVSNGKENCLKVKDILEESAAMATSYGNVTRQAEKGNDSRKKLDGWQENGLSMTAMKIVNSAENQNYEFDSHGMVFRKYLPLENKYSDEQLKIINSTIAITNDNWNTVKTAIGSHYYIDPLDNELKYAYGINGEVIIGKMILGENLGIYNSGASLQFNKNGLGITNGEYSFNVSPNHETYLLNIANNTDSLLSVTKNGDLTIKGEIKAISGYIGGESGWTIDSGKIFNGKSTISDTSKGIYIGTDGICLGNGSNSYIKATNAGKLTANNVDVSGVIKANTGYIGGSDGWTIKAKAMYSGKTTVNDTTEGIYLGTDGICLGNSDTVFKVLPNGNVTISLSGDTTTIDGSCIKTGTIDSARLNISDIIQVGGIATTDDIPTDAEITTITNNTIKTTNVTASNLKVKAANITGTLTIGQLPSTVAETSDIPTDAEITTITNNTIKTTNVTAENLTVKAANISGALTASQINAEGLNVVNGTFSGTLTSSNATITGGNLTINGSTGSAKKVQIQNGKLYISGGKPSSSTASSYKLPIVQFTAYNETGAKYSECQLYVLMKAKAQGDGVLAAYEYYPASLGVEELYTYTSGGGVIL